MSRALALARRGVGETNPNPLVGCVVVKGGRIVGEGWHRRAGGPHAEVEALRAAGTAARGATLYVNLEPCAHQGRTPPCAPLVAAAGIRRVVAATRDPNPLVRGRGLRILRREGVEVAVGVGRLENLAINRRFLVAAAGSRPFVLLKAAMTLDGRIATASGHSRWITSPAQRRLARGLRRLQDAVAVGVGTVIADDPMLMPQPEVQRRFVRIVFDSNLRLPAGSRLARTATRWPVWVLTTARAPRRAAALEARGVVVIHVRGRDGRVAVPSALRELRRLGIWSLMVEGGSELLGSFLDARAFDEVALFRGPLLLGGRGSLGAFGGPDRVRLSGATPMEPAGDPLLETGDWLFEAWRPVRRG